MLFLALPLLLASPSPALPPPVQELNDEQAKFLADYEAAKAAKARDEMEKLVQRREAIAIQVIAAICV